MKVSPFAGILPGPSDLIDIPKLIRAYETGLPDPSVFAQQVQFGTSGHRGCSLDLGAPLSRGRDFKTYRRMAFHSIILPVKR